MLVIGLPLRFYELAAGVTYYRDVALDDFFDEMSKKIKNRNASYHQRIGADDGAD